MQSLQLAPNGHHQREFGGNEPLLGHVSIAWLLFMKHYLFDNALESRIALGDQRYEPTRDGSQRAYLLGRQIRDRPR
ncbi:MAG: hypothetical protein R3B96_15580 [Pirellulaceae bacterium]